MKRTAEALECAGRAKRRRRFGLILKDSIGESKAVSPDESGLPPHSKSAFNSIGSRNRDEERGEYGTCANAGADQKIPGP